MPGTANPYREVGNQLTDAPLLVDLQVLRAAQNICPNCERTVRPEHSFAIGMLPCDPMAWGIRPRPTPTCPFVFVPHEQVNQPHPLESGIHPIGKVGHPVELAQQLNFLASLEYVDRWEPVTPTQRVLDTGEDIWYVAFEGGFGGLMGTNVQGYVRIIEMPHRTILHSLYVLPRHRGLGVGARLLDHALDHHTPLNAYDDPVLWTYLIRRAKVDFENPDVTLLPSLNWDHFYNEELAPRLQGIDLLAHYLSKPR